MQVKVEWHMSTFYCTYSAMHFSCCLPGARTQAAHTNLQERMTVEMENCRVLVSDQKIEQMKDIIPVLEQITRQNQPLLIVTEDITGAPFTCPLHLDHVMSLCSAHYFLFKHKHSPLQVPGIPHKLVPCLCKAWHAAVHLHMHFPALPQRVSLTGA